MMMNRFDLGGCCLARYGAATPYFVSKTDQIMSRYRPIAPKPVAQSTGAVTDGVQQQQALPPPVESCTKICSRTRTRKRSWDAASGGAPKRAARSRASATETPSANSEGHQRLEKNSRKSSVVLGGSSSQSTTPRPHSDMSEGGGGGLTLCEISDSAASKNFELGRPSLGYSSSSCTSFDSSLVTHKNEGLLDKDAAFMERAAASASPHVGLPDRKKPTNLMQPDRKPINLMQQPLNLMQQPSVIEPASTDASNSHTQKQKQQDLVTLPLLPIAPSPYRKEPPSNLAMHQDIQSLPHFTLSPKKFMAQSTPLVDISLLDHLYSASSDPVILTDDSYAHRVIWYNSAYKRLVSVGMPELGTPTPLASFKQPFTSSAAILWGFSKKNYSSKRGVGDGVIMPQPMRPVGSSVVVECITDTNLEAAFPISGGAVEEQLESQVSPCLISDSSNRVRWANSAYKQMIGQPECSWLDSTPVSDDHGKQSKSVKVTRIHGEVVLAFNVERFQLLEPLAAFSCRVKIQWTNGGEKISKTVPCDVVKINGKGESNDDRCYAWQFDIQAALSL